MRVGDYRIVEPRIGAQSLMTEKQIIEAVIPTLNEAATIKYILDEVQKYVDKILVIDGKSTDDTVNIVKETGARVIIQEAKGKGAALRQALHSVQGTTVIFIDADGSMQPNEIPLYLEELRNGTDVVKGSRFLGKGSTEDISFIRHLGNVFFVKLVNFLWSADFSDLCYGFIALNENAIHKLSPVLTSDNFEIETEIVIKAHKIGLKIKEVPSIELRRQYGNSNLRTVRDGFSIFMTILKQLF
jgi:glycosyltransferase involved in cell wall biosynthesis